jgi:hypothetical protein
MSVRRRTLLILAGAFVFGVLAALVKGPDGGVSMVSRVRSDLGNLSTPWLLVPFIAGTQTRRSWGGVLLGFLATMSALLGFYLLTSVLVDLGRPGLLDNFGRDFSANRVYFISGAVSGPLFGALGVWWRRTRSVGASVVAGALMMGEPIVLALIGVLVPATAVGRNTVSIAVYATELALGLALVLVARSRPSATVKEAR